MSLIEEPKVHRFTRDEYYTMADAGLFQDQRVELIEGEIIDMAPQKSAHFIALDKTQELLRTIFPSPAYWVRARGPITLADGSEPEPDVSVVRGTRGDYTDHPTSAVLLVEVSETTLTFDRTRKARVYAAADIPDYWIVNLIDRTLEVRRTPRQAANGTWSYTDTRTLTPADTVTPLAAPQASIRVADLLP